jgi:hypothetical protein
LVNRVPDSADAAGANKHYRGGGASDGVGDLAWAREADACQGHQRFLPQESVCLAGFGETELYPGFVEKAAVLVTQ